jgi:hypothetical protein
MTRLAAAKPRNPITKYRRRQCPKGVEELQGMFRISKEASAEMVNKLNRATVEAMESPNVSERLEGLGAVIVPPVRATPEYPAHCAQRDREMDGADQGKRGDRGVSRIVFAGLVRESWYAEFDRQLSVPALWGCARPCGRWTTPARAMAAAGCSIVTKTRESSRSSISLTFSNVRGWPGYPPKLSVNADITARQPSVESRCGAVAVGRT